MNISRRSFLNLTASGFVTGAWSLSKFARAESDENSLVESVRYLGKQFQSNPVNVTGLDGATSTKLPNGDALWVFGDTVEGPFTSIATVDLKDKLSNTGVLVPAQDAADGIKQFRFLTQPDGKRPRQIIPFAAGEDPAKNRVWPMRGANAGKNLYIFYHRITLIDGVNVFENFQLDGMGLARAKSDDLVFERLMASDGTREFWKGSDPTYGVWVNQADDYIYLWGNLMTGMFLARTRPEAFEDLANCEYLAAAPTLSNPKLEARWSKRFEPTAVLFDSVPNEMSATYNSFLGKWVAIHSFLRENKIVLRTAPKIYGPWSDGEIIYRPQRVKDSDLIYAAKEHPELARKDGKVIYATYVNSSTYVPELIEITLKKN
jgi:Domain of unknown function (DUF4185)